MTLLAIDPGRSKLLPTIGYCLFTDNGEEIKRGALDWPGLCAGMSVVSERLGFNSIYWPEGRWFEVDEVVVENFVNTPKSRGGQTNGASEVIGAIEFACAKAHVSFTRQGPDKLHVAQIQAQYRLPINPRTKKPVSHMPHEDSAYLHGYYYLVSKGVLQPKGLADTLNSDLQSR